MSTELRGCLLQIREHCFAEAGDDLLYAESDVAEKCEWIRVGVVQLIPHELSLVSSEKVGHQRGLARASVGGNERYWIGKIG